MSQMLEYKEKLLATDLFMKTGRRDWYKVQVCPYCGDAKKHFYVRIDLEDPDSAVGYKCFKCNCHGILGHKFFEFYNLDDIKPVRGKRRRHIDTEGVSTIVPDLLPADCDVSNVSGYIRSRIGVMPTRDDLVAFQFIGNPYGYASEFLNDRPGNARFDSRHWFRATNGLMLGRLTRDSERGDRWQKYSGTAILKDAALYTIKKLFDLQLPIVACICEGVYDCIGLYYYYQNENPNHIYIGCLGSDYNMGLSYLINHGIYGDSVSIKIFKDSDVRQVSLNDKKVRLFKSVSVFGNTRQKDYGFPKDQIELEKSI